MRSKEAEITLAEIFVKEAIPWFKAHDEEGLRLKRSDSVFSAGMVVWLMVVQKGIAENSLVSTIQQLRQTTKLDTIGKLVAKSKKFAFGEVSSNPSGLCHARKRLLLEKVEACSDYVSKRLDKEDKDLSSTYGYRAILLDGSTITLQNNADIVKEFSRQKNQYGEYQPAARVVVAHNAVTGRAYRPEIADTCKSEQEMSIALMQRLPKGSLLIKDRNFGVFSVVWHAIASSHIPLVRLQKERAQRILGKQAITNDGDHAVTWCPSRSDRETTELPENISIKGRVIAITLNVPGRMAERFFFFTTATDLSPEQVLEIYKKRWFIETDLRSIKQTVKLDVINSKSPDIIKKEIILGVLAYTLIRTIIARGAKKLSLDPREISFSGARQFVITIAIRLAKATTPEDINITLRSFLPGLLQLKHPKRTKFRSEPRVIAMRYKKSFPRLHGTRDEARQVEINKRLSGG
jgi:hypothetical protein